MASNAKIRQSELFAGSNWETIYHAFSAVNLQSYDFDTIRQSMVSYIQTNYPEQFTDFIDNSEFIFVIDLLAYLGQSLSFRVDLNTRENNLDTAERRESILRLARMLSYNPKRNFPARGILKLNKIRTTQEVRDSNGSNLANQDVVWNDSINANWFERFILVLNNAFVSTNPFGLPTKQGLVGNIATQLYQFNSAPLTTVADGFSSTVNGQGMKFEIVNSDFEIAGTFTEKTPDPLSRKSLIYRNDGAGNTSPNTGFFTYFKQGNLQFSDFQFTYPVENRIVDIDVNNINELDVWVEEINDAGLVVKTWTKVPTVENISFNTVDQQERNIFSIITRDNDQISIRFGDGRFGRTPVGLYRVWYRVSNGQKYQIRSNDLENIQVTIPYIRSDNNVTQTYDLTLTFNLEYSINTRDVGSSVPRETTEQIKQRANQVYYTQNRMVNGEDYNIFPLQFGNTAKKVKAINRIYSGQSRYIDVNDPTGRYQNTNLFAEDGIIYKEPFSRNSFESLPTIKTSREIINNTVQPLLDEIDLRDFVFAEYPRPTFIPTRTRWSKATGNNYGTTGQFQYDVLNNAVYVNQPIGAGQPANFNYLIEGALVKFIDPADASIYKWASIAQVSGSGTDPYMSVTGIGPVVLSETIANHWQVEQLISAFRKTLVEFEISNIEDQLNAKTTFALRYDAVDAKWIIITTSNIDIGGDFSLSNAGDISSTNLDASWLMLAEYLPAQGFWKFTTRNLRYVFESVLDARFYFVDTFKVVDTQRNLALKDFIRVLKYNTNPYPAVTQIGKAYDFNIVKPFVYADGFIEPRRVQITFTDTNSDGIPDDPTLFDIITDPTGSTDSGSLLHRYVYHTLTTDGIYEYFVPDSTIVTYDTYSVALADLVGLPIGATAFVIADNKFYTRQPNTSLLDTSTSHQAFLGRSDLNFQWKHYVPTDQRIDPSRSNIIDMYVLTETYYQSVQSWVTSLNRPAFPVPPTSDDLRIQFGELESNKMISDEIIWHSAKFKLLFGTNAPEELRAQFKVIKVAGTTVTDNEIKQKVINAINQFFNVDNWNFGEPVYVTELSSYVHQQLATVVASIVIVPNAPTSKFGNLFVIRADADEMFLSTASVNDIIVVDNYTSGNIKIGN